ncbi:MAG: Ig-like domain-containing protein [Clostridia bacterium]|nr:Ig-like domain-containing protein [Clostridia bacterium]
MKSIKRFFAAILVACIAICPVAQASALNIVEEALRNRSASIMFKAVKPRKLTILNKQKRLAIDQTLQLECLVKPNAALKDVMWYTSNTVVSISSDGLVTPNRAGTVKITARATAKLSVKDSFNLTVYDPYAPTKLTISPDARVLSPGESVQLNVSCEPSTAIDDVYWSSSNPNAVSIDENGLVTTLSEGSATITATAVRGGIKATALIISSFPQLETQIPYRTTYRDLNAIRENLDMIDAIYQSAVKEVVRLSGAGTITSNERIRRIKVLSNAFEMYAFPWYTDTRVRYWTSRYSGQKDFYPGRVYFGLPYIQSGRTGSRVNRRFNVNKAVSSGYYAKRNDGVYRMTSKRLDGSYVGNDCSAFVGAATFVGNGYTIGHGVCFMLTSSIVSSGLYRSVSSYDDLRPGDIIVRGHDHAIMFLYYVDEAKTQMMIIEQGGGTSTDMHNTVTCSIVNRSRYESKYKIRRAKLLA